MDKDTNIKHKKAKHKYINVEPVYEADDARYLNSVLELMYKTESVFDSTPSQREQGTDSYVAIMKAETPGESDIDRDLIQSLVGENFGSNSLIEGVVGKTANYTLKYRNNTLYIRDDKTFEVSKINTLREFKLFANNAGILLKGTPVSTLLSEAKIELPTSSKGIQRRDMPQIQGKDVKDFLRYIANKGIQTATKTVDPSTLKASQGHFHKAKIQSIMDELESKDVGQPIIVSKDGYVVDGHHRWLAHCNLDNKPIRVHQINKPLSSLLDIMHDYPKSFTKKLYEDTINEHLKKVDGKWAIVSRHDPSKVLEYYKGEGKPSHQWVAEVERRIQYFKHHG